MEKLCRKFYYYFTNFSKSPGGFAPETRLTGLAPLDTLSCLTLPSPN